MSTVIVVGGGCNRLDVDAITGGAGAAGSAANTSVAGATSAGGSAAAGGDVAGAGSGSDSGAMGGSAGEQSGPTGTCPPGGLVPGDTSRTVRVGATTRSYVLHVPEANDPTRPTPLIVDFHGIGSTGLDQLTSSPYPPITDPDGVIMAFPDGMSGPLGSAWNMGPCCVAGVDDVAFARALVADVQSIACIDPRRVYAVGVLTGGGMVYHLACEAAEVFAAVAPAAFDLIEETVDDCRPSRPITVISFRGTADTRVPYEGGASSLVPGMPITFLGAEASLQRWAAIDGCMGPESEDDENGCTSYSGCSAGVEVVLCTKDGGREDPGDPTIAWPALKRHSL